MIMFRKFITLVLLLLMQISWFSFIVGDLNGDGNIDDIDRGILVDMINGKY